MTAKRKLSPAHWIPFPSLQSSSSAGHDVALSVSDSLFRRGANRGVFPVLYRGFHGDPNKEEQLVWSPYFSEQVLRRGIATLNFTRDICQ